MAIDSRSVVIGSLVAITVAFFTVNFLMTYQETDEIFFPCENYSMNFNDM